MQGKTFCNRIVTVDDNMSTFRDTFQDFTENDIKIALSGGLVTGNVIDNEIIGSDVFGDKFKIAFICFEDKDILFEFA